MKLFKNFSLRKLLFNKRFTITFSVIMAFLIWIVITVKQTQIQTATFTDLAVNVNLEGTFVSENGMSIIGDISQQRFTVVVIGPTSVVSSLKSEDIGLYASAGEVDAPGQYSLKVSPTNSTAIAEYDISSITPPTLDVAFDYIDTEEFSITATAEGVTATQGLIAENGVVSGTESDTLTITGPRAVISQIETVSAVAKVNKTLSATETFDADIVLLDKEGNLIDQQYLTLTTTKVKVTVPISKKKVVPVKLEVSNAPSGFDSETLSPTYSYSTVTIIGPADKVDKISAVSLSPINLATLTKDSGKFDLSLKLPEGVRLLDSIDVITVNLNTRYYTEKTLNVSTVRYTGLSSGLSTSSLSAIKNVKICGPSSVIRKFTEANISAEVDLTDKKAGAHTIPVKFKLENYNNVWVIGEYTTTVTIK